MTVRLRPAAWADAQLLLAWANDPGVRESSFRSEMIAWEEHQRWLRGRLADRDGCRILIAITGDGAPVGQIRFERGGTRALTSYSVAAGWRGKGLGRRIIRAGLRRIAACWPEVEEVVAETKPENVASIRVLAAAGFRGGAPRGAGTRYVWSRSDRTFIVTASSPIYGDVARRLKVATRSAVVHAATPEALVASVSDGLNPSYVFAPDRPWTVPRAIQREYDCVAFRVSRPRADGPGGSPEEPDGTTCRVEAIVTNDGGKSGSALLTRTISAPALGAAEPPTTAAIEEMIAEIIRTDPLAAPPTAA